MDERKKQIKELCQSGAFDAFIELAMMIEPQEVTYSENTTNVIYQLGKRDGASQFKDSLFDLISNLAKS